MTLGAMLDHGLFYGVGKPGRWLAYAIVVDVLTAATTAFAAQYGLVGISIGFVGVAFAATVARWVLVGRLVAAPPWAVARPFALVAIAGVVSAAGGIAAMVIFAALPSIVVLLIVGGVVVLLHVGVVRVVQPATFREVVEFVNHRLRRRRPAVATTALGVSHAE